MATVSETGWRYLQHRDTGHVGLKLALVASLVVAWSQPCVRTCLLIGLASHAVNRARMEFLRPAFGLL
jgi:hypothetical protein